MDIEGDEPEVDEDEFWTDIKEEAPPEPESTFKTEIEFFRSITMKSYLPQRLGFRVMTWKENKAYQKEMKKTIQDIRHENSIEVEQVRQNVKASTRKELKVAVEKINEQFENEIHIIRLEYEKMKDTISKRNREINLLSKYMIDHETLITEGRLCESLETDPRPLSASEIAMKKALRQELNILKVQILGLKEAVVEYTNETAMAAAKIRDLDQEIAQIKRKHQQEIKELEVFMNKKLEIAIIERDKVKNQFDTYKKSGWTELEAKEESLSSKSVVILSLQQELKQAKSILHHPKLKLRVHNTLKDYIEEYEQDEEVSVAISANRSINKTSIKSKTYNKNRAFNRKGFNETDTNFTSFYSDIQPSTSIFYSRRSTLPEPRKAKLPPI